MKHGMCQNRRVDRRRTPRASGANFRQPAAYYELMTGAEPIVTIHLTAPLRPYTGGASRLEISASTVKRALEALEQSQAALFRNVCDETGALRRHLNVYVNAENIRDLRGLETALKTGDVVTFLPAVSGG
jgi:molybdopterin synthase sulfur carrier subunit